VDKVPFRISPMLATLADEPFSRGHWTFEEKYDGVRNAGLQGRWNSFLDLPERD